MVDTEHPVHVSLSQEEDGLVLETDLYDVLGDFTTGIINSDILGYAFEPDQRFENPDGTTIVFDSDFFGTHRGLKPLPGPFSEKDGRGRFSVI